MWPLARVTQGTLSYSDQHHYFEFSTCIMNHWIVIVYMCKRQLLREPKTHNVHEKISMGTLLTQAAWHELSRMCKKCACVLIISHKSCVKPPPSLVQILRLSSCCACDYPKYVHMQFARSSRLTVSATFQILFASIFKRVCVYKCWEAWWRIAFICIHPFRMGTGILLENAISQSVVDCCGDVHPDYWLWSCSHDWNKNSQIRMQCVGSVMGYVGNCFWSWICDEYNRNKSEFFKN